MIEQHASFHSFSRALRLTFQPFTIILTTCRTLQCDGKEPNTELAFAGGDYNDSVGYESFHTLSAMESCSHPARMRKHLWSGLSCRDDAACPLSWDDFFNSDAQRHIETCYSTGGRYSLQVFTPLVLSVKKSGVRFSLHYHMFSDM